MLCDLVLMKAVGYACERTYNSFMSRRTGFIGKVAWVMLVAGLAFVLIPARAPAATKAIRIVDFTASELPWEVVNDGVMGGVSTARVTQTNGIAAFRGQVRLENNGGFASMRSQDLLPTIPSTADSFAIRLRGDGRRYQFTVDTDLGWFWYSHQSVKAKWMTVVVPFDRLQPVTNFGVPVERSRYRPATHQLDTLGVLISNKRPEKFALEVDWIEAR
jgi:NADH dehydrogenase [ubiquinone] 1 alpha subcomplex assembly factor 1